MTASRSGFIRAAAAGLLLSSWLVLLFSGVTLGGAVYLLLIGSLVVFPWKLLRVGN